MLLAMTALITGVTVSSVGTAFAGGHHDGKDKDGAKRVVHQENECSKNAHCKNFGTIQDHIIINLDKAKKPDGGGGCDSWGG